MLRQSLLLYSSHLFDNLVEPHQRFLKEPHGHLNPVTIVLVQFHITCSSVLSIFTGKPDPYGLGLRLRLKAHNSCILVNEGFPQAELEEINAETV